MATPLSNHLRATSAGSPYTVERISSVHAIAELRTDWNRLSDVAPAPNVFTTYEWYQAWIGRLIADSGPGSLEPWLLVVRQGETIAGIAPMVRRVAIRGGIRVRKIEFLTHHADYNELVVGCDVPALTAAVLDTLARSTHEWDLLDLMDLRDDAAQANLLERTAVHAGLYRRAFAEPDGCLYMPIDAPWAEARSRKHLRFARRASLAFEQRAHEGFRARVIDRPHIEADLLQRIIAVEAQKHVAGQLSRPVVGRYREVFQALVDTLGPRGGIAIVVVEKDERLIAWRWLYRCGSKLWDYLTAYDHAFSELSPGTILLCESIDYGFAQGVQEFDFLRGMDMYKQRWTSTFRSNRRMILWSRRWKSRLAAWALLRQHARHAAADKTSNHAAQVAGQKRAIVLDQKGNHLA